ncbi:unnamed protein product [Effrenium voratum]|uniref:Uncharacterized protein n=1 Tax=Effrenium voratum TaxID=2562239 RepID=A0AA36I750_9DINO|nr:unnamed protein product [Effrenium voratum]CAJ1381967.1 unnamed protein product [Effrenium voratum]|eukprot:CAMPEP_0181421920 /NCGR_PEP_ID=MMETSP1110-20121109/13343_1 /TAXON_ID=174948 /ORGANISM="Symbiodinium sp., Strain CCMP421" /LENGTH=210 /DNA_ID=CAMNT_0023544993 /DNA_START=153 /DNA_END=785 /DNA_ORIENTATION=+
MTAAGEADPVLQAAGFAVCGEDEGADDEDGSLCPPPRASVCGGGDPRLPEGLGVRAMPLELWSFEKGSVSAGVGFACARDVAKSLLYANLMSTGEEPGTDAMKSAIRTLLDLAEACSTNKIIMGLSPEHASCEWLACSLLRLGFQVISLRKCPELNAALSLEFDMGPPAPLPRGNVISSSDYTCSGTSECSTSAEDQDQPQCESECQDSD